MLDNALKTRSIEDIAKGGSQFRRALRSPTPVNTPTVDANTYRQQQAALDALMGGVDAMGFGMASMPTQADFSQAPPNPLIEYYQRAPGTMEDISPLRERMMEILSRPKAPEIISLPSISVSQRPTDTAGWGSINAYGFSRSGMASQQGKANYGLQPVFFQALTQANKAMQAAGLGTFRVNSGYRSYAHQARLYAAPHSAPVAPPGRSVHGLGLAADLGLNGRQFAWLKNNGWRYGLWNLPSESWHWQLNPNIWRRARR